MENKLENPYFSTKLFGLNNYLEDLINTFENKIFPSTSLIIGKKGIGKYTLAHHFLSYYLDKSNYNDNEFKINNTEKEILEKMINDPGKTFSREEIGSLIDLDKERSIDVIITRLRKKIEKDPKNPKFLQTIRGAGYVLWIE